MKKFKLELLAIACAFVFSAFTKPFTMLTFKLKTDPVSAYIVSDPEQWTTAGSGVFFGACSGPTADLACKILLDNSKSTYFHTESGEVILNTFDYAVTQGTRQDYLVITEAIGLVSGGITDRIISSVDAYRWDPNANGLGHGAYVYASLGANLSFGNAQEIVE